MSKNRAKLRNIKICNARTDALLGGMYQNGSITERDFLWILEHILIIADEPILVKERSSDIAILRTSNPIRPGNYDIYCQGTIQLTDEPWIPRIMSRNILERDVEFRDKVRDRDKRCVISGIQNQLAPYNMWYGFEAAHVFPLEKEDIWREFDLNRLVTDMEDMNGVSKINSPQNGLLLNGAAHSLFLGYLISVNPDDEYRIISFAPDASGLDVKILDPVCRDPQDSHHVSDELLRWHFRQSVLANMRGAGEPIFEYDFPAGTDMMMEIQRGPYAQELLEMEFFVRLRPWAERSTSVSPRFPISKDTKDE